MTSKKTPARTILSLSALALLIPGAVLYAGPLDPPAGPVTSTYKTLTEVEPRTAVNAANTPGDADSLFRISAPGSYYLTGNITGVVGKHGIEINTSGVTLDLNGFEVRGLGAGGGVFDGITVSQGNKLSITIRNGSIRQWGDCGIEFPNIIGTVTQGYIISNIHASNNARDGISLWSRATISHCTASENGVDGISTVGGSTISHCSTNANGDDGISTSTGNTVTACSSGSNGGTGFALGLGNTISDSTASGNAIGISASGSVIRNCSVHSNSGNGIGGFAGNTIIQCAAYRNVGHGIATGQASVIVDCTAFENDLDGIRVSSACLVRGNSSSTNGQGVAGGAGIHATSVDNRIEGNNCTSSDRGIDVDLAGNIIIRNTCAGNTTDWVIVANNVVGPILDRRVPASAAINGFAAPSSLGTTDANANFSY